MATKKVYCTNCKKYDGKNCHKNGNIGILVKYRNESTFYLKSAEEINAKKDCKFYEKIKL